MRPRTAAAIGTLAVIAPLSLAGTAQAQGDKDCTDYKSQKAAQKAFDKGTGDPMHLDADSDKKACEKWPPGPGDPSNAGDTGTGEGEDGTEAPEGSVDAGGGAAADDPADVAPALAVAAGLSLATGAAVLARRRYTAADRTDADS